METSPCKLRPALACSFKPSLHPQFHTIEAECKPWILSVTAAASHVASQFWLGCAFPFLASLAYAHCATPRVVLIAKLLAWLLVCDSDDDDPSARGCENDLLLSQRHELLLQCYAGKYHRNHSIVEGRKLCEGATACGHGSTTASDENVLKITKGLDELHDIWKDISKDMSPKMLSRYLESMRDHLNANRLQAYYRKAGSLPGVEEYVHALRRPTSILLVCFILEEYGLGIELDEETLGSETVMRLQDAATDHVALVNDVFSCEAEKCVGDYFNLPCVILRERKLTQPGFTFADAMCEALSMIEEVDKVCVQLIKEVESSRLIEKAGVAAYLRGLEMWMAGNVEWSLKTARYSHVFSATDQGGVVRSLFPQKLPCMCVEPLACYPTLVNI